VRCATVTTMHGRLDLRDLVIWYRCTESTATCRWFRTPMHKENPRPWANWRATVYHGLPDGLYLLPSRAERISRLSCALEFGETPPCA
jgi:hypothetical protein